MKLWFRSLVAFLSFTIISSAAPATNDWTKSSSGNWEEPFWSLGTLPSADQEAVFFANPGWKALAIGANTVANFPGSLRLNDLFIDAPADSANQLLLNWAGVDVPLVVHSLTVGANGSVACHFSTLIASNVLLQGPATFSDNSRTTLERIIMRSGGALNINEVYLFSTHLLFMAGTISQTAGVAVISNLVSSSDSGAFRATIYTLSDGVLITGNASVGYYGLSANTECTIVHSGGAHTNETLTLWGGQRHFQLVSSVGHYLLSGGLLVSGQTMAYGGTMGQTGGTNFTRELLVGGGGRFTLGGGQLVTSNTTVDTVDCLRRGFSQTGGVHTVQNQLSLHDSASYALFGGTLSAPGIEINTGAQLALLDGAVSNQGTVVLRRGSLTAQGPAQQLGKLQVLDGQFYSCGPSQDVPAFLSVGSSTNPATIRFQDSRDLPWDATLHIVNWSTNHAGKGPDRIFFGASSQALTGSQLRQIIFIRPSGLPSDYSATLTGTGELVPDKPHDFNYDINNGTVTILSYTGPGGMVTVPNSIENSPVTTIAPRAFRFAYGVTNIILPNTITNIGEEAFLYCDNVTNITLGNGVIHIGDGAFRGCSKLSTITLPASLRELGVQAFDFCDNLIAIFVPATSPFFSSVNGVLFNKDQTRLIQYPPRKDGPYAVPQTVRSIEDYAFRAAYTLVDVVLPAGITNIGRSAFEFAGLTNINLPQGLRSIGHFAFYSCSGISSISLPDSLTDIGARVFEQSGLVRIEIPRSFTHFGGSAFLAYCPNLRGVYFRGDAPIVTVNFQPDTPDVIVYYLPGTVGWGSTYAGRPTAPWFLPAPRILNFGPSFGVRSNRFGFVISWATNSTVVVEVSINLNNSTWSAVSTNTLSAGSAYFSDSRWRDYRNRNYRVRVR